MKFTLLALVFASILTGCATEAPTSSPASEPTPAVLPSPQKAPTEKSEIEYECEINRDSALGGLQGLCRERHRCDYKRWWEYRDCEAELARTCSSANLPEDKVAVITAHYQRCLKQK